MDNDAAFRKEQTQKVLESKFQLIEVFADRIIDSIDKNIDKAVQIGKYSVDVDLDDFFNVDDSNDLVKNDEIKDKAFEILRNNGFKLYQKSTIMNVSWG